MDRRIFLLGLLSLAACARPKLLADDYAGSTATIKDSHIRRREKAWLGEREWIEIFAVARIDGKYLTNSSHMIEGGFLKPVTTKEFERRVPTKPIEIWLERYYAVRQSENSPSDLGRRVVTFTPGAGETYVVRGKSVGPNYSFDLWIEAASGQRVA